MLIDCLDRARGTNTKIDREQSRVERTKTQNRIRSTTSATSCHCFISAISLLLSSSLFSNSCSFSRISSASQERGYSRWIVVCTPRACKALPRRLRLLSSIVRLELAIWSLLPNSIRLHPDSLGCGRVNFRFRLTTTWNEDGLTSSNLIWKKKINKYFIWHKK